MQAYDASVSSEVFFSVSRVTDFFFHFNLTQGMVHPPKLMDGQEPLFVFDVELRNVILLRQLPTAIYAMREPFLGGNAAYWTNLLPCWPPWYLPIT